MRKHLLTLIAALALVFTGAPAAAEGPTETDFTAEAIAFGLTTGQAADLQDRVDAVLVDLPGGEQVSATEIRYDGLDVTVDAQYSTSDVPTVGGCAEGYFCIVVGGVKYEFYTCKTWALSNWWGFAPWHNAQTGRVVTSAWTAAGRTTWFDLSNDPPDQGGLIVDTWDYFRPCW